MYVFPYLEVNTEPQSTRDLVSITTWSDLESGGGQIKKDINRKDSVLKQFDRIIKMIYKYIDLVIAAIWFYDQGVSK